MDLQLHAGILTKPGKTAVVLLAISLVSGVVGAEPAPTARFADRVKQYASLHKEVADTIPKLAKRAVAESIAAHERALADGIRKRRAGAREGDILDPEVGAFIRKLIAEDIAVRPAEKDELREQNPRTETPGTPIAVAVNASYPSAASLSTVPPSLLARLPALPPEIDYRFVGRDLVLRDTGAHLIVDFLPDALP